MWLGSPSTAKSTASHPRPGARSTRAAPGAWRPHGPPRWPWRTRTPTLVEARVSRARSAPHARARLGCRTPRRATRRGRRGYFARRRAAGLGMRDFASELFRREIPRLLHLDHTGGPHLSQPSPAPPSTNIPLTAKSTASHPRPGARSTRAAPGAWRPNASGPVRWSRREGRNSVCPYTQARRRPGRHGGPGSGQPPLCAHGAQGVRFQCGIKSYSYSYS